MSLRSISVAKNTSFALFVFALMASILSLIYYPSPANGQEEEVSAIKHEKIIIASSILKKDRPVFVHLPENYGEGGNTKAYPVLYVLNRDENFVISSQIVDFLSSKGNIPEMIVVGVPHLGDAGAEYNPYDENQNSKSTEAFLEFLTAELVPFVDDKYYTLPSRILVGHSLAGLFTTHAFLENPKTFNAFIALSPSFHHGKEILNDVSQYFTADKGHPVQVFYMNIGGDEYYRIKDEYVKVRAVFAQNAPKNLRWTMNEAPNNSHRVMPFFGLYDGLTTLYHGYNLSMPQFRKQGYDGVIAHYAQLSDEFGYVMQPTQGDLQSLEEYFDSPERADEPSVASDAARYVSDAKRLLNHYYPK